MKIKDFFQFAFISSMLLCCVQGEKESVDLDLVKARNWFVKNEASLSKVVANSAGRNDKFFRKITDWNKNKVHTLNTGMKAVEVILDYDMYLISSETELKSSKPNSVNTLLLFEIRPGEYSPFILKIYPENPNTPLNRDDFDKINYGKTPNAFSGRFMFFDWDENFIGGWRIENGLRTKFIGRLTKGASSSNGRASASSSITCYQITTYWYSQACIPGGGCASPVLIDVTTTINCEYSLAPGDNSGSQGPGDPSENTCFVQHTFIAGLMVPCSTQVSCNNGFLRNWNGDCVCPTSSMEIVNGNCIFKCLSGLRRNQAGDCIPIDNCTTTDQIVNEMQGVFDQLWRNSNAAHTSIPMESRLENGGWIVNGPSGYSFVPFPSSLVRTPCGIDGTLNSGDIPANLVGMVHSHPFYSGEDTRGVCGNPKGEASYQGGPSDADYDMLLMIMNRTSNFTLKSYVIDGTKISSIGLTGAQGLKTFNRCGY